MEKDEVMKHKIRRTEITIETHEITITRRGRMRPQVFCQSCMSEVTAFQPDEVAALMQSEVSGEIHLIETSGEPPLICGRSLGVRRSK